MKKAVLLTFPLTLIFLGLSAFAHIEPGVYKGQTPDGKVCEVTAGINYFLDDVRHPLNERIEMSYDGAKYVIQHPPMIDEATTSVYFNHDSFHGVLATPTGGKALVIHMAHTEAFEGPVSFTAMDHQWKTGQKASVTCLNIKKQ